MGLALRPTCRRIMTEQLPHMSHSKRVHITESCFLKAIQGKGAVLFRFSLGLPLAGRWWVSFRFALQLYPSCPTQCQISASGTPVEAFAGSNSRRSSYLGR